MLNLLSGPLAALARYAITAAGGAVVARGYLDAATTQQVVGALIALVPAAIGAIQSTTANRIKIASKLPEVSGIKLNNGVTVQDGYPDPSAGLRG